LAILHVWKEIDLDDLLPLDDLPLEVVGEASDSSAVVADEDFSDLGFFFRFLPSTAVGRIVAAAMAVMMMSGDDNFILMILILFYFLRAETKNKRMMPSGKAAATTALIDRREPLLRGGLDESECRDSSQD
jgi:hypothetical protein